MKLEELMSEWAKDAVIDPLNPTAETVNTGRLHSKWMNILMGCMQASRTLEHKVKEITKAKTEYYAGTLADEDMARYGWKPQNRRILKSDIPKYLESDDELIALNIRMGLASQKVKFAEAALQQINRRNYEIRLIVDWEKFKAGM